MSLCIETSETSETSYNEITCNKLIGLVFKMPDGKWRLKIPKKDFEDIDMRSPYSGVLDRDNYKIYSILSDFNIDYKTIDEKYYQYNIESDDEYLYCYAYTENSVRAGLIHYIKTFCGHLNKLTCLKSIQYNIYKKKNVKIEEEIDFGPGSIFDPIFDPADY